MAMDTFIKSILRSITPDVILVLLTSDARLLLMIVRDHSWLLPWDSGRIVLQD
jgi:hypothetical protein